MSGKLIISFIGGGNMAGALIAGLARQAQPPDIRVCDPDPVACDRLVTQYGVRAFESIEPAVDGAAVIVLAVKPQVMDRVLAPLAGALKGTPLVISVAAGVTLATLSEALGSATPVVRTMPNTPALLGAGITGLCAGDSCEERHRDIAQQVMAAVGETVWVTDEALMDVVTAVSGSGPAYFYLLAEALLEAGVKLGLPRETASRLAIQTAHGAGLMASQADTDITELRRRVTSPGGTTQAAIQSLQDGGFEALVDQAVAAATRRGRELSAGTKPS